MMKEITISKSSYLQGLRCKKSLWMAYHGVEKPAYSTSHSSRTDEGKKVGRFAQSLYQGGKEVPYVPRKFAEMAVKTLELIEKGETVIYEASFLNNKGFARVDILRKVDGGWIIGEVKACTSVKSGLVDDVAFQYAVVSRELTLVDTQLILIDSSYVRKRELDVGKLFKTVSIFEEVKGRLDSTLQNIDDFKAMLASGRPDIQIGGHCTKDYHCEYKDKCWRSEPEHSIYSLSRLQTKKGDLLYKAGFRDLNKVPRCLKLSSIQQRQLISVQTNTPHIRTENVERFLDELDFPIINFDIETFQEAIPSYEGQSPFQQIPFQYSMHIVEKDGSVTHHEFLGVAEEDPRTAFTESLIKHLPVKGTVLAFNQSFEITQLKRLAYFLPNYQTTILEMVSRMKDLIVPFRNGGYYHPDFKGSLSIKSLLPVLFSDDTELDYKALEQVQDGLQAQEAFLNLRHEPNEIVRKETRNNLLAYCSLDTMAMVKIVAFLKKLVM